MVFLKIRVLLQCGSHGRVNLLPLRFPEPIEVLCLHPQLTLRRSLSIRLDAPVTASAVDPHKVPRNIVITREELHRKLLEAATLRTVMRANPMKVDGRYWLVHGA
jgi:hypothetical protein